MYLAGGFHSGWQLKAKAALKGFEFCDPRDHKIQEPSEYTKWDLDALRQCDVLLGNMEPTNPGGYALALEVGYAKALGITIHLVDGSIDPKVHRYFEMVRQCADHLYPSLDDAINALENSTV